MRYTTFSVINKNVPATMKTSLLSVWGFNETSGNLLDLHGSNDGTNTNVTQNVAGVTNLTPAYEYNGTSSYTTLTSSVVPATGDFTVNSWVLFGKTGVEETFFSQYTLSTAGRLNLTSHNNDEFIAFIGASPTSLSLSSTTDVVDGSFHMLTFTRNGNDFKLYVDGDLEDSTTLSGISVLQKVPTIGYLDGGFNYVDGKIDQTAIWGKEISTAEREALWNSGNGLPYNEW